MELPLLTSGEKMELPQCPKEKCFYWISPGGAADMSGAVYKDVAESFKNGKWQRFPDGGCSCTSRCTRLYTDGNADYYESC